MAPDYEGLKASDLPETFGRSVYEPKDGPERLALWQQIVASSEPARVDGVLVEPRWGRMLLDLYADLDPARQQTLAETRTADVGDLVKEWNTRATGRWATRPRPPGDS